MDVTYKNDGLVLNCNMESHVLIELIYFILLGKLK